MRTFQIIRFNSRYPDRSIVCDTCGKELSSNFYYTVYENGVNQNEYPFHTKRCAREFVRREITSEPVEFVYIMDGNREFLQEEATED